MVGASGLDWGAELVASLLWIAKAFGMTVVGFAVAAVLLLRLTRWGRQFWQLSGAYFTGRQALKTLPFVALLLLMTVFAVRMNVLFTYQGNDMFTALQLVAEGLATGDLAARDAAAQAFWSSMLVFAVLATVHVARALVSYLISQAFDIRWRTWLNTRTVDDWLDGRAYYRNRFIDATIDNPDQRIQQDVTDFVTTSRSLSIGAVNAIVSVASFTVILWELSGPMNVAGVEVPRAMMVLVLAYVLVTTVVAFWIGRPLIRLNFLYERLGANYRYALVRLRATAENVAFYRGEGVERRGLLARFAEVIRNLWQIIFRTLKFDGWNLTVNQVAAVFPWVIQAPRFIAGEITLGAMQQSARAFGEVHDSLSFFREAYDTFAGYRASLIRLHGLKEANDKSRALPSVHVEPVPDTVATAGLTVRTPDGKTLVEGLDLELAPGDALVIKGRSGAGKTTLLRTLARMWPFTEGVVRRPDELDGAGTLFLPQLPYLPLGDLRTAVAYPGDAAAIGDAALAEALGTVALGHLAGRLDEEADWSAILSPGEQQRVAFARILLLRPKLVFLDEATSAVDEGLEHALYSLVRAQAPETILVSVAHRSTVDQHHNRVLELDGDGPWRLREPVGAGTR